MGNCYYCNKEIDNELLVAVYDGYYCSKQCAKLSLTKKVEDILRLITRLQ